MKQTTNAHPFFAINLTRNFEIDTDDLRFFVSAMQGWKYIETEGIASDGTEFDVMYLWLDDIEVPTSAYDVYALAEILDKAGFDISPDDITVSYTHPEFTCDCCNYAPVLLLDEVSRLESICGNINNPSRYLQKVKQFAYSISRVSA